MGVETAIGGIGSLVQGNIDRDAKRRAAGQQRTTNQQAQDTLNTGFEDQKGTLNQGAQNARSQFQPFAQAGQTALQGYLGLLNGSTPIQASPQFTQASRLLKQNLASTGQSQSRSAVGEFSAPLISSEYNSQLSRFLPLISQGAAASGNIANSFTNESTNVANLRGGLASNIANLQVGKGDINATAQLAQAPNYSGALGQFTQGFGGGGGGGGGRCQLNIPGNQLGLQDNIGFNEDKTSFNNRFRLRG